MTTPLTRETWDAMTRHPTRAMNMNDVREFGDALLAEHERLQAERDSYAHRLGLAEGLALNNLKAWKHDAERAENAEAALAVARQLGMSIEPRPAPMVWALKNERAQAAEAQVAALRAALEQWNRSCHPHPSDHPAMFAAKKNAEPALAGSGPDYVPRTELEAETAKVKALQAAIEVLDGERYGTAELVCEWLESNGLKKPKQPADDELLAEVLRRGLTPKVVAAGMRGAARHEPFGETFSRQMRSLAARLESHRSCPHCNDMPYIGPNGANYACPECGVFRDLNPPVVRRD